MRLHRLQARNFRRLRDVDLAFPSGATAILGPNGAGKSTILEAIAFALYGTAALRTGKDLVRSSGAPPADAVAVVLEAEVGGQAVRIERELRGRNLTPSASLAVDGALIVPGGAGSSDAVDAELLRRVGVDRETFCTSVLSSQGELARLGALRPLERKQMILRLAGVARLDAMLEEARRRRREADSALAEARRGLPGPEVDATVAAAAEHLAACAAAGTKANAEHAAASAVLASAQAAMDAAQAQARLRAELGERLRHAKAQHALHAQLVERARVEAQAAEAAAARAEGLRPAAEALAAAEAALEAARRELAARQRAAQLRAEAERIRAALAAIAPLAPPPGAPVAAADPEAAAAEAPTPQQLDALADGAGTVAAQLAQAQADAQAAAARLQRLQHLGGAAACPTCEQPLGAHVAGLCARAEDERRDALARAAALLVRLERAQRELAAARERAAQAEARRREEERLAARRQHLEADLARAHAGSEAAASGLAGPAPDEAALAAQVAGARQAQRERDAALASARLLAHHLTQADEHARLAGAAQADAERVACDPALAGADPLPPARDALARAAAAERAAAEAMHRAAAALAVAEARLASAQAESARRAQLLARVAELEGQLVGWTAMAGRDGVLERFRDHLVARVGPGISAEASRLLAIFTGGRYTDLVLDSDYRVFVGEDGVLYPLERFSGGEQDLCHLALRIAVARLLCERSGADIRFLALDEVFGSLDRERRDLVVGALQGLGSLYPQVLVVSHLEGLREALGSALTVVADGDASSVSAGEGAPAIVASP